MFFNTNSFSLAYCVFASVISVKAQQSPMVIFLLGVAKHPCLQ